MEAHYSKNHGESRLISKLWIRTTAGTGEHILHLIREDNMLILKWSYEEEDEGV